MKFLQTIFVLLFFVCASDCYAQKKTAVPKPNEQLNQKDSKGIKQGMWLNRIKERRGEPAYSEFGNYLHGQKTGLWYKVNTQGDLVAIENYRKDVFDGEVRYFTNGQVTTVGNYRGLNPDILVDTIMVEDPVKQTQTLVPIKSEVGSVRHGTWRYYNETTGMIVKIEEYQIDDLIYEEYFKYSREDSLRFMKRMKNMPDPNVSRDDRPAKKKHSYLNY